MRHSKYIAGIALLLALSSLVFIYGKGLASVAQTDSPAISDQDREFVSRAVKAGLAEVALGQLAITKSASNAVKQLGEYVVKTHGRKNAELAMMAKAKRIALPQDTDTQFQELGALLRSTEGAEFDRLYIYGAALTSQIEAAALFEQQAANGKDPDLRDFARRTLPSIKKNIEIIRMISAREPSQQKLRKAAIYV